ncbi:FAD binding domain-containing protein [Mycena sanguinolenta]|uniref:FAD binding domain-containing protein n=1 Tax=Mycena sanguinolenta TaxID=230812 RepID=A0A8H7DLT0_9AGAR|nr:FAD binding domain-containing protein [Mycena sanguinolenta]
MGLLQRLNQTWKDSRHEPSPGTRMLLLWLSLSLCPTLTFAYKYCTALDACWPSTQLWNNLNASVGGRIIAARPPAAPCHVLDPLFNEEICASVNASWTSMFFRADQPGASQDTYWENGNSSCYIDFNLTTPCEQGLVPAMILDVHSLADVQKGVNFAREHQLRLRIKSSGHDYVGRASGEGSFLIWTRHIRSLALVPDFVPIGAPTGTKAVQAMRSGPGDRWTDLYNLANRSDVVVVGGTGQTVSSAGGYLMGGGHSLLSRHYGLAVDNVLQFILVDASGSEVVANAYQNPDLFWSLRGGGGGTFGVVTEVVRKTHPAFHNILGVTLTVSASSPTDLESVLKEYLDIQPSLDDAQWWLTTAVQQTSFILQAALFTPPPGANLTQAAYQAFQSVILAAQNLGMTPAFVVQEFPNFLALHDAFFPPTTPSGSPGVLASRLIPRHVFENTSATALLAHAATEPPEVVFNLLAGGAVSKVSPTATSVNPGWRKALHLVIFATGWTSSTPLAIRDLLRQNLTAQDFTIRTIQRRTWRIPQ